MCSALVCFIIFQLRQAVLSFFLTADSPCITHLEPFPKMLTARNCPSLPSSKSENHVLLAIKPLSTRLTLLQMTQNNRFFCPNSPSALLATQLASTWNTRFASKRSFQWCGERSFENTSLPQGIPNWNGWMRGWAAWACRRRSGLATRRWNSWRSVNGNLKHTSTASPKAESQNSTYS